MRSELLRRFAPWTIAAALVLSAFIAGFMAFRAYGANELRIVQALENYDKLAAIAAARDVVVRDSSTVPDELLDAIYLGKEQPAVLSANLLTLLEQLAANQGLAVNRESALPPRRQGAVTRVGAAMALSGSLPAIYGFLEQVEAARPALFIDRIDIRVGQTGFPEEQTDTIASVEIEVSGLVPLVEGSATGGGT
jgi:hypothetical protein